MNYFTIPAKKAFNQLLRGQAEEPEESESVTIYSTVVWKNSSAMLKKSTV